MKSKKLFTSFLVSVVTMMLCLVSFAGTTLAWFTDTVSNTGNRIQAGTLKVNLLMDKMQEHTANSYVSIANGTGDIFATDETKASEYKDSHLNGILWEPGKTEIAYLAVENEGNLALKYKLVLDVQDLRTHEGKANTDMAKAFYFVIVDGTHDPLDAIDSWEDAVTKSGMTPKNLWDAIQVSNPGQHSGRIDPAGQGVLDGINQDPKVENERDYFAIVVHMDENAGNDYQAGTILFDLNLVATQLNSELDGFESPDYDKFATFPSIATRIDGKGSTNSLVVIEDTKKIAEGTKEIIIKSSSSTSSMTVLGNAKVPSDAVNEKPQGKDKSVIEEFLGQVNPVEGATTTKDEIILNLNVDTKEATTTKIVLDVTMDGVITRTTDEGQTTEKVQTASMVVSELADAVTVELQLDPDLEDVRMTHSHNDISTPMIKVESIGDLADNKFFYDSITGKLSFKTSKFSDFLVEYTRKAVAECTANGVPMKFAEAINSAEDGKPLNIKLNKTIYVKGNDGIKIKENKNIILDLDGWTIIGQFDEARGGNLFNNKGTLTIKDTSKEKDGKLTDEGLTQDEAGNWHTDPKRNYADNVISNYGVLNLESGTIEQGINGNIVYCVDNYSGATFNMTGGHLYNYNTAAVRMFCNSTTDDNIVNISGGLIEGCQGVWVQNPSGTENSTAQPLKNVGHLNISGGTFDVLGSGTDAIYSYEAYYAVTGYGNPKVYYDCSGIYIDISGGVFNSKIHVYKCSQDPARNVNLAVSGGSFIANTEKTSNNSYISLGGGYYYFEPSSNRWAYYNFGDDTYEAGWYYYSGDFIADCAAIGYIVSADENYMYVTPSKVDGMISGAKAKLENGYLIVTIDD